MRRLLTISAVASLLLSTVAVAAPSNFGPSKAAVDFQRRQRHITTPAVQKPARPSMCSMPCCEKKLCAPIGTPDAGVKRN